MKTGIIIITYNIPVDVVLTQIRCIEKHCKDDFQIVIVDNSDEREAIDTIAYHVNLNQSISYFKTNSSSKNGSDSHAFAANFAYSTLKAKYDHMLFLDHDCIPIKDFSIKEMLGEDKCFAGIGHGVKKRYFWPGCFALNNAAIGKDGVNFSPSHELTLDTGGHTFELIEKYGEDKAIFFNEEYAQNEHFTEIPYNYYALINNQMFIHFVNGSNWNVSGNHNERINSLLNIVNQKL